jgi:3-methyladenine DNA glycosylase/8-oxoguanine DNA glycosylase
MSHTLFLQTPANFDFKRTVLSHGWCELLPFEFDQEQWTLSTVIRGEKPISVKVRAAEKSLQIELPEQLSPQDQTALLSAVSHIFRFDDDLQEFYDLTRDEPHLAWLGEQNAGRLLRSATVFEDLVKTICTTNCNWALTRIMVTNLVEKLGEAAPGGKKAFPNPQAMAAVPVEFYKAEIRAGYRAAYFRELAERIAGGELQVEDWLTTDLPTPELKKELKKIKGVGDYAAENLLKLLGRYDGLALDSWLRGQFYKKYNDANPCDDKRIRTHYERYGKWRGLVIWCEMTEKWL